MKRRSWRGHQIFLHWLSFVVILGLFFLGDYMVDLDYYDPWYHRAPYWHKSIGLLFFFLICIRLFIRLVTEDPGHVASHKAWERAVAGFTHFALYLLILIICVSGYLISSADGRGVAIFEWFEVPATLYGLDSQEDVAGSVHEWAVYVMLALAALHALAAIKHHIKDKDETLRRMLRSTPKE